MPTGSADERAIQLGDLPEAVAGVLSRLTDAGHEAALVGGCVRDLLRGASPKDWDVATSAAPEVVAELFPGSTWENRFGTVTVHLGRAPSSVEVTTYRVEGAYLDRRRPDEVRWGTSLVEDLGRRDFTINAMAWRPDAGVPSGGVLVDPFDGFSDLQAHRLRAVGDPDARLAEDALRLLRAVRFATRFGLRIDERTAAAIIRNARLASGLSGERIRDELLSILAEPSPVDPPSHAFLAMEHLGLLAQILPELAALRGVPQDKVLPGDALDHSLRTADALSAEDPVLRLIGLLHDIGKAPTMAEGHFYGHEVVGAQMVELTMRRLHFSRGETTRAVALVRQHMFVYTSEWSDAAVRRFIRRVGVGQLTDLFTLRHADNVASGVSEPPRGGTDELQARVGVELATHPLNARQLAVHGDDLVRELSIDPGPVVGDLLARLLEAVIEDPARNERAVLLDLARQWLNDRPRVGR